MFEDRTEAGRKLAARLGSGLDRAAVVLALPRGGLPVAAEIARTLRLPLDLMLVRKVGLPGHAELALAAIAGPEGEEMVINEEVARSTGLNHADIRRLAVPEVAELKRRRTLYLGDRPAVPLTGRTVILVDDGIATGATMLAAIRSVRKASPSRIILAVPVAPADTLATLRSEVDEIVCLDVPPSFYAVGAHYHHFPQVSNLEVTQILAAFAPPPP